MAREGRYVVQYGSDEPFEIRNLAAFCREQGLKVENARSVAQGKRAAVNGWTIRAVGDGGVVSERPEPAAVVEALDIPELPKDARRAFVDAGSPQDVLAQLRRHAAEIMDLEQFYMSNPGRMPEGWNAKQRMEVLKTFASLNGIDFKKIGDTRDVGDKALDAAARVVTIGGGEMLSLLEDELDAMEEGMERCRALGIEEFAMLDEQARGASRGRVLGPEVDDPGGVGGPKAIAEAAERWIDCLRRIRMLRLMARKSYDSSLGWPEAVQRGTHLLRFMLYVGRSDLPSERPADKVYRIGRPQVRMAMHLHLARAGYAQCDGVGLLKPGDRNPKSGGIFPGLKYSGIVLMAPPRHTKSDMMKHLGVLLVNERPTSQNAYVTAVDDMGSTMLKSMAEYFNPSSAQGRRNLSLFPNELADYDNNANNLRIATPNPPRQPQMIGHGIFTSRQGINLDFLILDDPVTKDDRVSETDRERRKSAWRATWLTRLQGDSPFLVVTGYPHHNEDLMWSLKKRADLAARTANADGTTMWQCIMPVGGPQTNPRFKSIWPEMYDEKYLERKFRDLNDPVMWSANYMLLPISEGSKLVEKVRLYDCTSPQHQEFVTGARYYIGVDPAAKGDGTGDKAGLVIGAEGDWVEYKTGPMGTVCESETQLRVVMEDEFHATQMELNHRLLGLGAARRVDRVYIEAVVGLGSAMAEVLREIYGVTAVETEGAKTNKEARLRAVAPLVEDGTPGLRAKVLFPGVPKPDPVTGEMKLELHPSMERLVNYIVNFAVTEGHHSLDAFTLLVKKRMQHIGAGMGSFSKQVAEMQESRMDPRLKAMFEKSARERRHAGSFRRTITHSGV